MNSFKKLLDYFNDDKRNDTAKTQNNNISTSTKSALLSKNLASNLNLLKQVFSNFSDIVYRDFKINNTINATLIFLDSFVDKEIVSSDLLKPLINFDKINETHTDIDFKNLSSYINNLLLVPSIESSEFINTITSFILSGSVAILIDDVEKAFLVDLRKIPKRNIAESIIEPVIRGPHDSFTEDLSTNIVLVRKRLKTSKLKIIKTKIGSLSQTDVAIAYIEGIANSSLVDEILRKLSKIDIDAVLESGYIEEILQPNKLSVFSQFGYTERPDRVASSLVEGHLSILIDNTPIVLMAPHTIFHSMQSSEDYYQNYIITFFLRLIRYAFLVNALLLPSLYIAILSFHQGMIPRNLLLTIIASREGVPFPVLLEALLMEIFFEALREAGIRLPSPVGQTVSIVGALVIGEAAVKAGIVSSTMVIIVSITGISSFVIPRYNLSLSIRFLRFGMILLSGVLGLYGLYMGVLILLIHLAKLKSFGVPYLSPLAPLDFSGLRDIFIRMPWFVAKKRPEFIKENNSDRSE